MGLKTLPIRFRGLEVGGREEFNHLSVQSSTAFSSIPRVLSGPGEGPVLRWKSVQLNFSDKHLALLKRRAERSATNVRTQWNKL